MNRLAASAGLLAACWLTATPAADWQAATVTMPAIRVGAHSYYVQGSLQEASAANQGFMSNAGFVVTGEGVVVFDALASPGLAERLIETIRGVTEQPIRYAIISHYHADHFYGAAVLRRAGAQIWAQKAARDYLDSPLAAQRLQQRRELLGPWLGKDFELPVPDHWVDKQEVLELGGLRFSLLHVGPAHAPDDLVMRVEPDGVLYAGDVISAGRIPYVGQADTRSWLRAIAMLLDPPARVLVPGHGPASRQPRQDLQLTQRYLVYLRERMGQAVAGFQPFEQAYAQTDWRAYAHLPAFDSANRQNAYNVYLQMEQESLRQ